MNDEIHIGKLIQRKLKEQERSGAWLARKLFTDPSNVSKIIRKQHIDTELLMRISLILNFDFFNYLSESYQTNRQNMAD
ncbi:MAG: XRE family transcriptional regulator [Bacteroidales bacterium]|nr:XRE family transcriptional regulator [Bacteroidales bacterium]MBR4837493.1 XRE family transcriptional regulator [Bacteroidales bacterium]